MPDRRQPDPQFSVKLTQAQRKVVAEITPEIARRLKINDRGQRPVPLSLEELRAVKEKARDALRQGGTGRARVPLRGVFLACGEALDQHLGAAALPEQGVREWFLAELQAVAGRFRWQYAAPNRQQQVAQIAYRIWQEEGRPEGREDEHWWRAEKEFHADKPIRGASLDGPDKGQGGPLLSPWQAVVHAKTDGADPGSAADKLAEGGFPLTPGEAVAIDAAADASSGGYSAAFRTGIARAVGLER
jgi:hypothetical protein